METFQQLVLFVAIFILIFTLVFIGINLKYRKSKSSWPPIIGDCPDYWVDISGNGAKCVNVKDLGTCKSTKQKHLTMDFTGPQFKGENGLCSKYTWAKNCGISWDGITYGVNNPCTK